MSYVPPSMRNKKVSNQNINLNEEMEIVAQKPEKVFPSLLKESNTNNIKNYTNNTNNKFLKKVENWRNENVLKVQEVEVKKDVNNNKINNINNTNNTTNKFNALPKKTPQIIVASQKTVETIETSPFWEFETQGNWIDPYAAKRRKNARANARREIRRIQRLNKEVLSDEEDEQHVQIAEEPETMWKD